MPEYTGRTIKEAVETGLQDLGLSEEAVEITVLDEGHSGVFGLGSRPALVRLTPRPSDVSSDASEPTSEEATRGETGDVGPETQVSSATGVSLSDSSDEASASVPELDEENDAKRRDEVQEVLALSRDFLQNMLDFMGLTTTVEASFHQPAQEGELPQYYLNIAGDDLGILIGRRGETLASIQYLVRLVANRHTHRWLNIEVDVQNYKRRRERTLQALAERMADRAVRERRTVILEAMPARERRIVHLALRDREDVYTESIGEGDNRKVTIIPT
ncbi:MAG: protein jag [Chloroflexi bacterium]|nr:protein jag [Chloroflexota bacterium]